MTAHEYSNQITAAAESGRVKRHFYEVLDESYKSLGEPSDYCTIPQAKKYARLLCKELGRQSVLLAVNDYNKGNIIDIIEVSL